MPLNGNQLATEVKAAITTVRNSNPDPQDAHNDFWVAICNAIVDHIKNNAQVVNTPDDGAGHTHTPATII